jgi:hypothetical protein
MRHHSLITWEPGHVRAAVVQLSGGTAEMLGVSAAPVHGISSTGHPDVDRWYVGCEKALSQAEDMTPSTAGHKIVPDYVTMCVPAEICSGLQVQVNEKRRHASREISSTELATAVRASHRRAEDMLGESAAMDADIVHASVIETTVDGKSVTNPIGFTGEELALTVSFDVLSREWISALQTVSARMELLLACLLPQHAAYGATISEQDALLLLLDDHYTLVSHVQRGRVSTSEKVATGTQEILDAVGSVLNLQGRRAAALMRAFRDRQLREEFELYVARAFWAELRRWLSRIAETVLRMCDGQPTPTVVYFRDLSKRLPEGVQALETPFWEQQTQAACCPEVVQIEAGHARNALDCTARASDSGYLLLRAAAHTVAGLYSQTQGVDSLLMEQVCTRHIGAPIKRSR